MSLTTLPAVKLHLGIADDAHDRALLQLMTQAESAVKRYVRQPIEQATYTDYYAGNGTQELFLRYRPVQSITSIYLDPVGYYGQASGAFGESTLLTAGVDYCLVRDGISPELGKSGIVQKIGGVWPAASQQIEGLLSQGVVDGIGNIKVTYVAGYATVPPDIVAAVHQFVAEMIATAGSGGTFQSESFDYYSYERANPESVASAMSGTKNLLAPYREVVI